MPNKKNVDLMMRVLVAVFVIINMAFAQAPIFKVDSSYLQRHDIVYNTPAYEGFEGFPLGNGDLGGLVWNTNSGFEIQINKTDLFDATNEEANATLRNGVRINIDLGAPGFEWMYLDDFKGRLSLKNAEANYTATTPFMHTQMSSWVSQQRNVWYVQLKSNTKGHLALGTKLRVSLERWGSRTFPGWYGHFSKDTKSGLGYAKSYVRGKDIILEANYGKLRFAVACRVVGEEINTDVTSDHKSVIESKARSSNKNIVVMVSMVT